MKQPAKMQFLSGSGGRSNVAHPQLPYYFQPQRRPYPHFRLTPLEPSNEDIFVNQIKGELKKMAAVWTKPCYG